jgi:hypothetical protein
MTFDGEDMSGEQEVEKHGREVDESETKLMTFDPA